MKYHPSSVVLWEIKWNYTINSITKCGEERRDVIIIIIIIVIIIIVLIFIIIIIITIIVSILNFKSTHLVSTRAGKKKNAKVSVFWGDINVMLTHQTSVVYFAVFQSARVLKVHSPLVLDPKFFLYLCPILFKGQMFGWDRRK